MKTSNASKEHAKSDGIRIGLELRGIPSGKIPKSF
jgi:hypothetical protein